MRVLQAVQELAAMEALRLRALALPQQEPAEVKDGVEAWRAVPGSLVAKVEVQSAPQH